VGCGVWGEPMSDMFAAAVVSVLILAYLARALDGEQ
jgi:hypothetical protein